MKLFIPMILFQLALAQVSTISTNQPYNLSLTSNLPPPNFKISIEISAPLLPVNAALLNILFFMGIAGIQGLQEELAPRTYSAPGYRQVEISLLAWIEVRFSLWGIYLAAKVMVRTARFHDHVINLYWEDQLVGRMRVARRGVLGLPGHDGNGMFGLLNETTSLLLPSKSSPSKSSSDFNTTESTSAANDLINLWTATALSPSLLPALSIANKTLAPRDFTIHFDPVIGASKLSRNDVFVTFFTAILHVAQFEQEQELDSFTSKEPNGNLFLHMEESMLHCQYGRVISVLSIVPKYMIENAAFGYKETQFSAKVRGLYTCQGALLKNLVPEIER